MIASRCAGLTDSFTALAGFALGVLLIGGCGQADPTKGEVMMNGSVQYLNPDGLHKNPAYSQAVVASGNGFSRRDRRDRGRAGPLIAAAGAKPSPVTSWQDF